MKNTYILATVLLFIVASAVGLARLNTGNKTPQPVACSMIAKLCPDGTAVGRTGPNCEFAACPDATQAPILEPGNIVLGVGENGKVGDVEIILNSIVQDSRCPLNVQCIWAGEVKANITMRNKVKSESLVLSSIDKPHSFGDYDISITDVTRGEYHITFHVSITPQKISGGSGTISGRVTLSPVCPVERMPPDPQCAPRGYLTKIEARSTLDSKVIKTAQTLADGNFSITIPFGGYTIYAGGDTVMPRCSPVEVDLKSAAINVDISCDSGIR